MRVSRLRSQLLILALAPALVIATILTAYQIVTRLGSLDDELTARLDTVADHFSVLSEYAIYSGDVSTLELAGIQRTLEHNPEFEYAVMRNGDNKVLIEYGNPLRSEVELGRLPDSRITLVRNDSLVHHHPVIDQSLESGAVLDPAFEPAIPTRVVGWVTVQYTLRGLQQQRRDVLLNSSAITLFGLLFGTLLAFRLGVKIERPIHGLVDTVRRLGRGELDVRADLGESGEIASLERGINLMAGALESSHQQLQSDIDRATEDLQQSLESVRSHEARYRELVQNIGCLILQTDAEQRILFINQFAEEYFGLRTDELVGKNIIGTIVMPEYADEAAAMLGNSPKRSNIVGRHLGPSGERRYINWSIRPLRDERGVQIGSLGVGIDITERHRYQRSIDILAESNTTNEQLYARVVTAAAIGLDYRWAGVLLVDRDDGEPRIHTLLELGRPVELQRDDELRHTLTEIFAGGQPVEMVSGVPPLHLAGTDRVVRPQTLLAVPLQVGDDCVGLLFALCNRSHHPTETGHQIVKLCAERLQFALQREWAAQQLTRARDEAVAATRSKSRLLANVSHEIRTPMNGILGFARLLLRQPLQPQQRQQVELIDRSAGSLLHIINDILDLSRIEVGKMVLKHEPFDPVATIEEVTGIFAQRVHAKGLALSFGVGGEIPDGVVSDPVRFQQLLENLIGNAMKFTDRGSIRIRLEVSEEVEGGSQLRVSVRDTGPGIDKSYQRQLFEAFSQVPETGVSNREGTGLGLSICHQIVQLLGGEIGVQSEIGNGSTFWFTLPVTLAPVASPSRGSLNGMHAVIQEPNPEVREDSASLLRHAGADVETVSDDIALHELLAANRERPLDLVVLSLPAGGQADAPARFQALNPLHAGPVLILTEVGEIDCPPERCEECSGWCAQKPLRLRTLIEHRTADAAIGEPPRKAGLPPVHHVLVVDDNDINRMLATTLFDEAGIGCSVACDGLEAVEMATRLRPDLILMDIQMPRLDGREARNRIVEHLGTQAPKMVALTAFASSEIRQALLQGGFDDVLDKPLIEDEMWRTIGRLLSPETTEREMPDAPSPERYAGADTPVYDPGRAMAITGGKQELSLQMIRMLLQELPGQRALIEVQLRDGTPGALRALLHKLGGSAQYCALTALAVAIEQCEMQLERDPPDGLQGAVDAVLVEMARAERFDFDAALGLGRSR